VPSCSACGTENRAGKRYCSQCGAALEAQCPGCGAPTEPGDRFCGACGTALADGAVAAAPAPSVSERRLVSVLFADLVGFTTLSEHRDPEEVRELLSRYFERCRTLIERYGGTVEKFIGDAVMAVWGTPVAREDDAERAVRAALALSQAVTALGAEVGMPDLRVRAGVLTGNAAVDLGAESEGMVLGDTVNTASRLQSIAEPGTVLVDDVTRRASEAAIAYEAAGTHQVKGREQPVRAWIALSVVAGAGGARRSVGLEAPFVGRGAELERLIALSDESARGGVARLVTITAEAGHGKSRIAWEFFKYVDGIEEQRFWHEGRCLSYGEGVAYWALAEMIRSRAGIAEEEEPNAARVKLRDVVEQFVIDERERRLVEPRLAHLLGLEQRSATEPADLFSGWRLFFERMAETTPVILVFDDVQWADSGLLDFIDYLLEWSADHPIFILAAGRPELEARRRDWGTALRLGPLPSAAMQALLGGLVPGLPEDVTERILERAEGVPLYAVETVRMLLDRGALVQEGSRYVVAGTVADLEVPETLHALVAARLDNLDAAERGLLQDAAVLGTSFSATALAAVSGRPEPEVRRALDHLVVKQVLGRDDDPRASEPGQYRFLQALLRTIAMGTLSRRDRKARHLAAAAHLRATWGEATEIAEVLASHYLDAVSADPDAPDADAIRTFARETLTTAGQRAASLAAAREARRYFERAAGLADDEAERARLLAEAGAAASRSGAIAVLDAGGFAEDAGRTRARLVDALIAENRLAEAAEHIDAARRSLTDDGVLAELAARRARIAFLTGDVGRAYEESETALSIADPSRMNAVIADAALTKAIALYIGRRSAEAGALFALGLELALEADLTEPALRAYYNLGDYRAVTGRMEEAGELLERGIALARERGYRVWERDFMAQIVQTDVMRGRWDEALAAGEALRAGGVDDSTRQAESYLPVILAARGETGALEAWLTRPVAETEWRELALVEDFGRAVALGALGRLEEAAAIAGVSAPGLVSLTGGAATLYLTDVIDALIETDRLSLLEELLPLGERPTQSSVDGQRLRAVGLLHARRGELREAEAALAQGVAALRRAAHPYWLARILLDHGALLVDQGRPVEAAPMLREARAIFAELRAAPWLERTDRVLEPLLAA
jgi:class 3 adenylate cyclase/tetratricopeptide (TPR) repeat protein